MTVVPDVKKFCLELYETVQTVSPIPQALGKLTSRDLVRAVTVLKTHWKESTEGKHFAQLSDEERSRVANDVTHLYDIVEKKTVSEILSLIAQLYAEAAWIQTGHFLASLHSKEMWRFGDILQHFEEFKTLPTDVRASVEVAQERFVTKEKKLFVKREQVSL